VVGGLVGATYRFRSRRQIAPVSRMYGAIMAGLMGMLVAGALQTFEPKQGPMVYSGQTVSRLIGRSSSDESGRNMESSLAESFER